MKKYSTLIFRGAWENHPKLGFGHHGMEMVATPIPTLVIKLNLLEKTWMFLSWTTSWTFSLNVLVLKPHPPYDTRFYITRHKKMKLRAGWSRKNTAGWIFWVFVKNSFSIGKGWGDSVQLHRLWPFVSHKNKHTWLSVFCWKFKNFFLRLRFGGNWPHSVELPSTKNETVRGKMLCRNDHDYHYKQYDDWMTFHIMKWTISGEVFLDFE